MDVGNRRTKAGLFRSDSLLSAREVPPGSSVSVARIFGVSPSSLSAVVVSSVSEPRLEEFLAGPGQGALVLGRDLAIPIENRYARPDDVGIDRLANAAAAHSLCGGTCIVVDAGSAATVDAVSADGAFLGGAIAPGLHALARGLELEAPRLPPLDGEPPKTGVPASTAEALRFGIFFGYAGLLARLVSDVRKAVAGRAGGDSIPVILTGGDADRMTPWLDFSVRPVPHLTLRGVYRLYSRSGGPVEDPGGGH